MKTCEEFELAASCYVDQEPAPMKNAELFHHLASCDGCSVFLGDLIRIRVDAAREKRVNVATASDFSASTVGVRRSPRSLPDKGRITPEANREIVSPVSRTLALALLLL